MRPLAGSVQTPSVPESNLKIKELGQRKCDGAPSAKVHIALELADVHDEMLCDRRALKAPLYELVLGALLANQSTHRLHLSNRNPESGHGNTEVLCGIVDGMEHSVVRNDVREGNVWSLCLQQCIVVQHRRATGTIFIRVIRARVAICSPVCALVSDLVCLVSPIGQNVADLAYVGELVLGPEVAADAVYLLEVLAQIIIGSQLQSNGMKYGV